MNSDTQYTGARFTTFPTTSRRAPGTPSRLNECSWTSCLTLSPSHCACDATASLFGNRLCESAAWRWSVLEASSAEPSPVLHIAEMGTHTFVSAENLAAVSVNMALSYAL